MGQENQRSRQKKDVGPQVVLLPHSELLDHQNPGSSESTLLIFSWAESSAALADFSLPDIKLSSSALETSAHFVPPLVDGQSPASLN